ncbi:superoxide dismutase [Cu-Zn] isoform X2 [Eurytemora carolleeae]|uniref:superoxide dismutase [Cu-Zn] isoform X2 n=1 Tax=Eurytemora carolleeae TaxID=1294199 RepID=UPI000C79291A|nr:superoxide dismutase [Cu-Zn] isoform X2 [Eurytemora carolleeae]|eukprot:XP_023342575.1 superoxide dismutase [Cu-Zn]-like isoform X2 [Eurytemora affinis]
MWFVQFIAIFVSIAMTKGMEKVAECEFHGGVLQGEVKLHYTNDNKDIMIMGTITNLTQGYHGFHIHEFGKLSNKCLDAGPHYNPTNTTHGSLTSPNRHAGDLENILADGEKVARVNMMVMNMKLEDVIGRSMVVHEMIDDLGLGGAENSLTTGNSGDRLDCCLIHWVESSSTKLNIASGLLFVLASLLVRFL